MVTTKKLRELAFAFPGCVEQPHFEKRAFKIGKGRIFCTVSEADRTATVKLTEAEQSVYCQVDPAVIYPVPNKWGKHGWTIIELTKVRISLLREVLKAAEK